MWKVPKHFQVHRGPPWTVFKKRSPRLKIFLNFLGAFKDFHGFELVSRSSKTVFWSLLKPVQNHF